MPKSLNISTSSLRDANSTDASPDGTGIYTWVIGTDTVYCDALVADVFGFSPAQARRGLPAADYFHRMHPDDLPRIAKAIHDTMVSGAAFSEQYRVCRPDGTMREVTAFGSCFRDAANEPSHYSGIVFPVDTDLAPGCTIISNLLAAHDLALRQGRTSLAAKIVSALAEASGEETDFDISTDDMHAGPLH